MKKLSILLISLLFSYINCSGMQSSYGRWNDIVVFADDEDWNQIVDIVKTTYEKEVFTPQSESLFYVYHPPFESFKSYDRRRFVIMAGTLGTGGTVGTALQSFLTPEVVGAIESGDHIFVRENEWVNDQIVIFLIAPTIDDLAVTINNNSDRLFRIIDEARDRLQYESMFKEKEKKEISTQIFDDYGFTLRVQHDYYMAKDDPGEKYIWLRRFQPDRMLFVHWIDTVGVESIPEEWVISKRKKLAADFMDNAQIYSEFTSSRQGTFIDYFAVETRGLWVKESSSIGGPLVNYTFYDDKTSRIYMIDMMVFAPEFPKEKEPFIRQMDIIGRTFTTTRPRYLQ